MKFEVHPEAVDEFLELPEKDRNRVEKAIESRRKRKNSILDQRGTGISYDNHGEPVHYFKIEDEDFSYRVFFDIVGQKVVLLGIRSRDDETYLNLREYTSRS